MYNFGLEGTKLALDVDTIIENKFKGVPNLENEFVFRTLLKTI